MTTNDETIRVGVEVDGANEARRDLKGVSRETRGVGKASRGLFLPFLGAALLGGLFASSLSGIALGGGDAGNALYRIQGALEQVANTIARVVLPFLDPIIAWFEELPSWAQASLLVAAAINVFSTALGVVGRIVYPLFIVLLRVADVFNAIAQNSRGLYRAVYLLAGIFTHIIARLGLVVIWMLTLGRVGGPIVERLQELRLLFVALGRTILGWVGVVRGSLAPAFYRVILFLSRWGSLIRGIVPLLLRVGAVILGVASGPIGIIIAAIGLMVTQTLYLWKTSAQFRTYFRNMWYQLSATVIGYINRIIGYINTLINAFNRIPFAPDIPNVPTVGFGGGSGGGGSNIRHPLPGGRNQQITVNVYGSVYDGEEFERNVERALRNPNLNGRLEGQP